MGHKESIFKEKWPEVNPEYLKEEKFGLIVQINGKVREKIEMDFNISEEEAKKLTLQSERIKKLIEGKEVKRAIFVKNKLINIVI